MLTRYGRSFTVSATHLPPRTWGSDERQRRSDDDVRQSPKYGEAVSHWHLQVPIIGSHEVFPWFSVIRDVPFSASVVRDDSFGADPVFVSACNRRAVTFGKERSRARSFQPCGQDVIDPRGNPYGVVQRALRRDRAHRLCGEMKKLLRRVN